MVKHWEGQDIGEKNKITLLQLNTLDREQNLLFLHLGGARGAHNRLQMVTRERRPVRSSTDPD